MLALIALLFVVAPLVELYVIIQVGQEIGALNTIGLMVIMSIVGAWLARHEGMWVLTRIREQMQQGQVPTNELIDGALILAGGVMLFFPGFVSDVLGLLLLFPPTRVAFRSIVKRRFRVVSGRRLGGPWNGRDGYDGPDDVIDV